MAMTSDSLRSRRVQYETNGLDISDVLDDPIAQWHRWYSDAEQAGCVEPNAMVLSTVDADGLPDSRYLLARGVSEQGFEFYTNYDSAKSQQLVLHPRAAGLFTWLQLHRQLRVRGSIERMTAAESDAYFASRPRQSQLGAWASPQSTVLQSRAELERLVDEVSDRFAEQPIVRPESWGGWRLVPSEIELWQGRPSRLHDRLRYRRSANHWIMERLAP